jgi:predicted dehydrogenase
VARQLNIAFLGCGFITAVHSRSLARLREDITPSYASRNIEQARDYSHKYGGVRSYGDYRAALDDPTVDAVAIAVPPHLHLPLTLEALAAKKHVLVEKPAFPCLADFECARTAAVQAGRVVLVGENDHYKPLAVCLRRLLADGAIGEMVLAHFTTLVKKFKSADDWRNDEAIAGGDAFFEEGIHWLHLANSLGPKIVSAHGYRPHATRRPISDRRAKSMLVSFLYDNGAAGSLYYSREVPSLFRGLRLSKLFGRDGIITFESNGTVVLVRGEGMPELLFPGFRDIRGYQAMYRDFASAIMTGRNPEMNLDVAIEDQRVMEQIYESADVAFGTDTA